MTAARVICGSTLSFSGNPRIASGKCWTFHKNGALAIGRDGKIAWAGARSRLPEKYAKARRDTYDGKIIAAGFIDAHIHFPQYRMLAAPGLDLLDWLARFTFPEEARYKSRAHAQKAAGAFLDHLARHGTTCAAAFCSVHKQSARALFEAAAARNMAIVTGKTMMDRNAPDNVCDTPEQSVIDSEALLNHWHGRGRARYAITPRFAITSSDAQLRLAGELWRKYPDALMQTHLSESHREIEQVRQLFPSAKDYTDVYDGFGLLGPGALFGHAIHLSAREVARLAEADARVVHCPTSNTFLGSGLFDMDKLAPVTIGLATDVGGGTSYSMLATMGEAYKIAMLKGCRLSPFDAFYLASLGNACALHLDDETGSLDNGKWADLVVLDPQATPVLKDRHLLSKSLEEMLFALLILGDDRAITATYIAGKRC